MALLRRLVFFVPLFGFGSMSLATGCRAVFGPGEPETPVLVYGEGKLPDEPPPECAFVERIEVTRLENKSVPIAKLQAEARNRDANAVAHIRPDGMKDGYLGKEYRFVASVYECPEPKGTGSASPSGAAPSSSARR